MAFRLSPVKRIYSTFSTRAVFKSRCVLSRWKVRFFSDETGSPPSDNYRFASSHEWATLEGRVATMGISYHAQNQLGDVVYVDLPDIGKTAEMGEEISAIESVKAAEDIHAPMSGTVVEVNKDLQEVPEKVNKSPYIEGWMVKLEVSDPDEFAKLMTFKEYKKTYEE